MVSRARPAANKWIITATVLTGTIMAVLDSSIVNVALPEMSGSMGATLEEITWVVTAYILAQVIVMPITGLLAARIGRKRFYLASVITFTTASMACGLARTLPVMVVFRIAQGFGGGVLLTVSQAILRESFPPEEQGMAMGLYGLGAVLAPAFGPTVGGWLTDSYSWPWIFYVNVPIGVLCVVMVLRFLDDPPYLRRDRSPIDWSGLGLLVVGLGAVQLMLEEGERYDWFQSRLIALLALVGLVGLVLFVIRELRTGHPAVNLRIARNISFSSATSLGGMLGMALNGSLFLLPVLLQTLLGYDAMQAGITMMPRSLAMAVLMPIGGRFYNQLGPRILIGGGLLVAAFGFWDLTHLTTNVGYWDLFWPQVWQGVGFSLIFVALSTAALSTIPKPKMTDATGLYNVVRQVMGSVGIAVAATLLSNSTSRYHDQLVAAANPAAERQWVDALRGRLMTSRGADVGTAQAGAIRLLNQVVSRQATIIAYNHVFALVAILFLFGLPLVFLIRTGEPVEESHVAIE